MTIPVPSEPYRRNLITYNIMHNSFCCLSCPDWPKALTSIAAMWYNRYVLSYCRFQLFIACGIYAGPRYSDHSIATNYVHNWNQSAEANDVNPLHTSMSTHLSGHNLRINQNIPHPWKNASSIFIKKNDLWFAICLDMIFQMHFLEWKYMNFD